jgi:site-specific recombinase XerD
MKRQLEEHKSFNGNDLCGNVESLLRQGNEKHAMEFVRYQCQEMKRESLAILINGKPCLHLNIYLHDLADNHLYSINTITTIAYALAKFEECLTVLHVSFWDLSLAVMKEMRRRLIARCETAISTRTANRYLGIYFGLVSFWQKNPALTATFARLTQQPELFRLRSDYSNDQAVTKSLSVVEVRKLFETLHSRPRFTRTEKLLYFRDPAVLAVGLMGGLRKGEVVRLRIEDLARAQETIFIKDRPGDRWLSQLKTGEAKIPVPDSNPYWSYIERWYQYGRPLAEAILDEKKQDDHGLMFCLNNGAPFTLASFNHFFEKLSIESGINDLHPHRLRHTFAQRLFDEGFSELEVQKALRHRSITSTQRYLKPDTAQKRKEAHALYENQFGGIHARS